MTPEDDSKQMLKDFQALSEEMEILMQDFFDGNHSFSIASGRGFLPSMDCFETETEFACLLELAGVAPQDLSVELDGSMLVVSGFRREIPGFDRRRYHKMELDFGFFERTISIPEPITADTLRIENVGGFYLIRLKKKFPGLKNELSQFDPADPDTRR